MTVAPVPASPAVEAVALRKAFGPINAVDGIDLSLPAGRIYGMLGPNGSGKTTLIRLLTGLTSATSGTARVLGVAMPSRTNLARIGYMTQADGIYPELSVWENLSFFAALYGQRDRAAIDSNPRTRRARRTPRHAGTPAIRRHAAPPFAGVRAGPPPRPCSSSTSRPSAWTRRCGSSSGTTSIDWPRTAPRSWSRAT